MPRSSNTLARAVEAGRRGNYQLAAKILGELISETDAPPEAWLLLGRSFHALKDYSHSLAAFNDYLRLRPKAPEGYFFAGRTYLSLGMPYRAVPLLRKALVNSRRGTGGFQSGEFKSKIKALLGTAYLKSKQSPAAVQMLQEAVEAAPNDKRIYRAYINCLFVRGIRLCGIEDYELGLQMLRFVLTNSLEAGIPESPLLRLELGRAARETGNLNEALEHFTAALRLTGNGPNGVGAVGDRRIRWARASVLMALGKTTEARKEIEKIRSSDSGVPELPWNSELVDLFMIRSLLADGEWRRASEACRAWLRTRDDRPFIRALYAEALRNLGSFEAAHNHLQRALEHEPEELEFWHADILVSWEGKDYKALKKALRAVKSLGGDMNLVKRFSILCQVKTSGDIKNNITILQDAVKSLGPEPELMYLLGEVYLKAGLLEEAASWFKKTIALKKSHENAYLGEIAALEAILAQGTRDNQNTGKQLLTFYRAYLSKWPSNPSIRRDMALFYIKTFEYAKAASELEKLLVWEPANPSLRRVLAYSYRKTGRYREAALYLKSLLKEKPNDIGLIIEYSGCLERAGAAKYALAVLEKARKFFDQVIQSNPTSSLASVGSLGSAAISLALGILSYREKETEKAFDYLREAAALAPIDPRPYEWMAIIARKNGEAEKCGYYENEAQKRRNAGKSIK